MRGGGSGLPSLEVIEGFAALMIAVSIDAEYEQVDGREIGDDLLDVLRFLHRIPATHSRAMDLHLRMPLAEMPEHRLEDRS